MRVGLVAVSDWLGQADAPLEPSTMQYQARIADKDAGDCAGCVFKGQKANVCMAACAAARLAGIPDCEDRDPETGRTFVYTLTKTDPRQLRIDQENT